MRHIIAQLRLRRVVTRTNRPRGPRKTVRPSRPADTVLLRGARRVRPGGYPTKMSSAVLTPRYAGTRTSCKDKGKSHSNPLTSRYRWLLGIDAVSVRRTGAHSGDARLHSPMADLRMHRGVPRWHRCVRPPGAWGCGPQHHHAADDCRAAAARPHRLDHHLPGARLGDEDRPAGRRCADDRSRDAPLSRSVISKNASGPARQLAAVHLAAAGPCHAGALWHAAGAILMLPLYGRHNRIVLVEGELKG